jgi:hypothetical protein
MREGCVSEDRNEGTLSQLWSRINPLLLKFATEPRDKFPDMRRLLTPVNAGMSAARHVIWFISYHATSDRPPAR